MVDIQNIDAQLFKVGMRNRFFARPEVRELCHILVAGEVIKHAVVGQYEGGFALIIATDRRVLLVDKKPWFLTMEDIRYDMISEVDYFSRMVDATLSVITINKKLTFTSWRKARLRELVKYIQNRVLDLRRIDNGWVQSDHPQVVKSVTVQPTNQPLQRMRQIPQTDFIEAYQRQIRLHSLAHIVGKMATDDYIRPRPVIKPLYLRPSLVSKYKHRGYNAHMPVTH